jgi:hypothetical protein
MKYSAPAIVVLLTLAGCSSSPTGDLFASSDAGPVPGSGAGNGNGGGNGNGNGGGNGGGGGAADGGVTSTDDGAAPTADAGGTKDAGSADAGGNGDGGAGGGVTTLATNQASPKAIALDDTNIYWTNSGDGTLYMLRKSGGAPILLVVGQSSPSAIATTTLSAGTQSVAWVDPTAGTVMRQQMLAGDPYGQPQVIAKGQSSPQGIAVSGDQIVWSEYNSGRIDWMGPGLAGTMPRQFPAGTAPLGVVIDGARAYIADYGTGAVLSQGIPPGGVDQASLATGGAFAIAVDATNVYFTAVTQLTIDNKTSAIVSVPKAGGAPTTLAPNQVYPGSIAIDATSVYWTDADAKAIRKVAKTGGAVTTLAKSDGAALGVAVDATYVYFLDVSNGNGSVKRVAK